jgi:hypothetical protein
LAADLFAREFDAALRQIEEAPEVGAPHVQRQGVLLAPTVEHRSSGSDALDPEGHDCPSMISGASKDDAMERIMPD